MGGQKGILILSEGVLETLLLPSLGSHPSSSRAIFRHVSEIGFPFTDTYPFSAVANVGFPSAYSFWARPRASAQRTKISGPGAWAQSVGSVLVPGTHVVLTVILCAFFLPKVSVVIPSDSCMTVSVLITSALLSLGWDAVVWVGPTCALGKFKDLPKR